MNNATDSYRRIDEKVQKVIRLSIYECLIALGCVFAAIVILIRVFYGTELTDEAFYVSDAVTMMHGSLYYAYNNYLLFHMASPTLSIVYDRMLQDI